MKPAIHVSRRRKSGLTLVEILIGVGVLGILMAIAAPSMADLLARRRVIAAAEEVAGLLTFAKSETNATNGDLLVIFDTAPGGNTMSCAAVITAGGMPGRCRCYLSVTNMCPNSPTQLLRAFQLPADHVKFTADATTWSSVANRIRFTRTQMDVGITTGFHVDVVSNYKQYTLRVEVNPAGRVKVCTPNGDMSGYSTCV